MMDITDDEMYTYIAFETGVSVEEVRRAVDKAALFMETIRELEERFANFQEPIDRFQIPKKEKHSHTQLNNNTRRTMNWTKNQSKRISPIRPQKRGNR